MAQWQKTQIQRDNGMMAEAQAPVIISASRSTDIPAFYADWFFHRLKVGYSAWTNPGIRLDAYMLPIQKTAYKGMDLMPLAKPKFLLEIR